MTTSDTLEHMSTTEAAPLVKTHKIRLAPTARQQRLLAQNCGYARKAYNAALAHSQQHAEKEKKKPQQERRYLSAYDLSSWWTEAKKTVCVDKAGQPWYQECNQVAAKNAIVHGLGPAYDNWRRNRWNKDSAPTFHKKGRHDSYRASNGRNTVKVEGQHVFLPKIGRVRMREPLRFTGDVLIVTVSRTADWWDVAITVETPDVAPPPRTAPVAGVDVGINPLAMVSDGTRYENPRAFARMERKLRRLQKAAARSPERPWSESQIQPPEQSLPQDRTAPRARCLLTAGYVSQSYHGNSQAVGCFGYRKPARQGNAAESQAGQVAGRCEYGRAATAVDL